HAHSWIMSFPDELSSFRAYADVFPDSSVLLVDTYDTLKSGIPNAIIVARELREKGHELRAVRLDSGDLAVLSRESRRMLDEAGFPDVKILASNELDEYVIRAIREQGGRVDIFGVGTRLATCQGEGGGALGGVYKLVRFNGNPKMKVTSDISKSTIPDRKRVFRAIGADGTLLMDILCREDESPAPGDLLYDPRSPAKTIRIPDSAVLVAIRSIVMDDGAIKGALPSLPELADRCRDELARLPIGILRFEEHQTYGVYVSEGLHDLRMQLIKEIREGY
nr:nicotinate phosphoribosyltransferase [Geobacteraceae bacterium]